MNNGENHDQYIYLQNSSCLLKRQLIVPNNMSTLSIIYVNKLLYAQLEGDITFYPIQI